MNKKNLIIISSLIGLFIIISILVCIGLTNNLDNSVYNFIISFRSDFLDSYFKFMTKLGNTAYIIIILGICILLLRNKYALYLCICTSFSVIVNLILKYLFRRDRPDVLKIITQGGYSFPSGHSMITMCCFGYLFYYVYKYINNRFLKIILLIILGIIIISIPISRIYLGVHYFSDVIAGLIMGGCILFIVIKYGDKFIRGN